MPTLEAGRNTVLLAIDFNPKGASVAEKFCLEDMRIREILTALQASTPGNHYSVTDSILEMLGSGELSGSDLLYLATSGLVNFLKNIERVSGAALRIARISEALMEEALLLNPSVDLSGDMG